MAGHDQERVVDADADADHRRDLTGEVGCVDERGPEGDGGERHEDARDRSDDRKSHRDDGAEREQQDHHGGEETEELGRRHLAVGEGVAAERHLDRGAVGDLLHRERGDAQVLCRVLVVGCEVDRRERDVPIRGEAGGVVERRVDVGHTREDGDVAHDRPDGCLVRGRAEIGVGPEDHDGRFVALRGQVGAHEVERGLDVGAVEAVARLFFRVDSAGHDGERDRRHEPEDEGAPTVRRTGMGNSFNHASDDEGASTLIPSGTLASNWWG